MGWGEPQGPNRGYDSLMPPEPAKRKRAPDPMPDIAQVLVYLNRKTGEVKLDEEFSTPMETWGMLSEACALVEDRFEKLREKHDTG